MFTGLVEALGNVDAVALHAAGMRLTIGTSIAPELGIGDSLAINGCCLTVTSSHGNLVSFDLLAETLHRTNLGGLPPGSRVNLERALGTAGRFGGHFVQGHIDTTTKVISAGFQGEDMQLSIALPSSGSKYLIEKGSIAVNGVSLTVATLSPDSFGLWIIPHTLQETNLGDLKPGDPVNLEYDVLAKYVERQLATARS
jgi:riboflavin synthase